MGDGALAEKFVVRMQILSACQACWPDALSEIASGRDDSVTKFN